MYFIRPNPAFFDSTDVVPASRLSASMNEGVTHFYLRDIKNVDRHVDFNDVSKSLLSVVTSRLVGNVRLLAFIRGCSSEITKHLCRLRYQKIQNEVDVQYVYGDPIVDMLVSLSGY